MSDSDDRPAAGTEAARLLAAAQDWLRTSAPHLAPTGVDGSPCSCPVCRAVVSVRDADPDSVARWVDLAVAGVSAAVSQAAAAAGDLASRRPDASTEAGGASAPDEAGASDPQGYADASSAKVSPPDPGVGHDGPGRPRVRRVPLDRDQSREPGGPTE